MEVRPIFNSFTTGEATPLTFGRTDFAKYGSSLRTVLNYLIRPHGPLYNRPGLRFVCEVKDSSKFTRLFPFEFSTEQAYQIEAGHLYFRFLKDGGRIESPPGTPVEVVSPYTETDLPLVKKIQSHDTAYFFHPNYPIYKLTRQSHTSWTLAQAKLMPPPTFEDGHAPAATLTLSATTGLGVTLTASAAAFLAGDVNRLVTHGTGRAIIVGFTSTTVVTADIVDDFSGTGPHAAGTWKIEGSPVTSLTPSIAQPTHARTTLTLAADGWRTTDVGRYVRVNKGVCRIISVATALSANAEILSTLENTTAAPGGAWSVEDPTWSVARGFPRGGTFHEQRLVAGGAAGGPGTFNGSNPGEYEKFALGPDDDDAYEFTIAANDSNSINWLSSVNKLMLGTSGGEFSVKGSDGALNAAISPNSVDVKPTTFWGASSRVTPVRIGNGLLYVDRSETELREQVFAVERDSYVANDMLLLSEHLTEDNAIIDIAYQRHPNSTVWCVRDDGTLLALAYQREHDVAGWSRHLTGEYALVDQGVNTDGDHWFLEAPDKGRFEAVAVTPHWQGKRDVAFFVVRRTINGATKRFVEYFDATGGYYKRLGVDSGLTYSGAATNTVTGLSHLNGETVTVLADGSVRTPTGVVAGGSVTFDGPAATQAEIGLGFTSVLETMRPEVPQQGTSQGVMKRWAEIYVRLHKSIGLWIDDEEIDFRQAGDPMDAPPPLFTGDKSTTGKNRDRDAIIRIEQRLPMPQTIIAVFGRLAVGEK